ncbi:MAG: YebC/PmpR family DNA-binding transcriptional regulator [Candidatus Spechtbacterales bacterium]
MSGHSKWSTIKHKKAANDAKRSAVFNKIARAITIEARQGGGDINANYALRTLVEKAKGLNMPKDKIETATKKGTGELKDNARLEELLIEGFGPGGVALLIKAITDNRNRTVSEIKHLLDQTGAKFTGENSVRWMFKQELRENEEGHKAMEWIPQNTIKSSDADAQKLEKLYEALDDQDDVQEVYSNEEY